MKLPSALSVVLCLFCWGVAGAQCFDPRDHLHRVGYFSSTSDAFNVNLDGGIAYLAERAGGVEIVDISDPSNPQLLGSIPTDDAWAVAADGSHAYVADGLTGLVVVDISDPTDPSVVTTLDTPGRAQDVVVVGDFAYIADRGSGMHIVDISDPTMPSIRGTSSEWSAQSLEVIGNYVYTVGYAFAVIDVSDPDSPSVVGALSGVYGYNLSVSPEGYAAVAEQLIGAGARIVDVSVPETPVIVSTVATDEIAWDVATAGDMFFIAHNGWGIVAVDAGDIESPAVVGRFPSVTAATGIDAEGNLAALACSAGGLWLFDVSNPTTPGRIGLLDKQFWNGLVDMAGTYAYVTGKDLGLDVVDISDPAQPTVVGNYAADLYGLELRGDYVYAVNDQGLKIIDVSDPFNPIPVAAETTPRTARRLHLSGTYAYIGESSNQGTGGLRIMDISDPLEPTLVGGLDWSSVVDLAVAEPYAFLAATKLTVVDITNPADPQFEVLLHWGGEVKTVAVKDQIVYAGTSGALELIDVSDPTAPVGVSSFPIVGSPWSMTIWGDLLFLGTGSGLTVFDLADPWAPEPIYHTKAWVQNESYYGVVSDGSLIAAATHWGGLQIYPAPCPASAGLDDGPPPFARSPARLAVPNPMTRNAEMSYALTEPSAVNLHIYDVTGRLVKRLVDGNGSAGTHRVRWSLRSDNGGRVPGGVYFLRLRTAQGVDAKRFIVVR